MPEILTLRSLLQTHVGGRGGPTHPGVIAKSCVCAHTHVFLRGRTHNFHQVLRPLRTPKREGNTIRLSPVLLPRSSFQDVPRSASPQRLGRRLARNRGSVVELSWTASAQVLGFTEWKGESFKKKGEENTNSSNLKFYHHPQKNKSESEITVLFFENHEPSPPAGPALGVGGAVCRQPAPDSLRSWEIILPNSLYLISYLRNLENNLAPYLPNKETVGKNRWLTKCFLNASSCSAHRPY